MYIKATYHYGQKEEMRIIENTTTNKINPNITKTLICLFFSKETELNTDILYEISLLSLS